MGNCCSESKMESTTTTSDGTTVVAAKDLPAISLEGKDHLE